MRQDFDTLDKIYRVTEKEEILKYEQVGKTALDYYSQKDGIEKGPSSKEPSDDS
jgi:hypothetical protein